MADIEIIQPIPRKDPIELIEKDELVEGGPEGAANKQAIAIANNLFYKELNPISGWNDSLSSGYPENSLLILNSGKIVRSLIDGNKNNPNLGLDGWVDINDPSMIFDSKIGLNQEKINSIVGSQKFIDVRYFGIFPGLPNDLGGLINSADAKARSYGVGLYFPAGTYLATGLLPSVSWVGAGKDKTLIKNHGTDVNLGFCLLKNSKVLNIYDGITFDGAVSGDPLAWNSENYNSFTGAIPFAIDSSSKVILNIDLKNAKMSDLRIINSSDVFLIDVELSKARGNFGDGIYIGGSSRRIFGDRVRIKDVTRIGLVFEGNTQDCVFKDFKMTYAHDCSRKYGGGEYNGGVWAENAHNIFINDGHTDDTGDYGFLMTTGNLLSLNIKQAYFELRDCSADNVSIGFSNRSKQSSVGAKHKLYNCKSSAYISFLAASRYSNDEFEYYNCEAVVRGGLTTMTNINSALMLSHENEDKTKMVKVKVDNFEVDRAETFDKYNDTSFYDSDITIYGGHYFDIDFRNIRMKDGSNVYFKNRLSVATDDKTLIKDSKCYFPVFYSKNFKTIDGELAGYVFNATGKTRLIRPEIKSKFSLTSHNFKINDADCDFNSSGDFLEILATNEVLDIAGKIYNSTFKKDITAGDFSLKFQSSNSSNKAKLLISSSEFYNKSAISTSDKTHIWVVRSPSSVIYQNVMRDSTAHLQKLNTSISTSEPNGSTSLILH